ncbi:MAG: leucine-rich repeat domain-containing protein [Ruminococcaceae bacterium]|nr:leucine-rich repeat domain-containing protein [Oscillospiraceae bacterium]
MENYSKGLKYKIINDECCEVVGRGWCFKNNIVIPPMYKGFRVTGIGESAFEKNEKIISVVIPEGVTSIGKFAFHKCTSLQNITLPETLQKIGRNAFGFCGELSRCVIPENVQTIEEAVFLGCKKLREAIFSNVKKICCNAFGDCVALEHVNLSSVTEIENEAFFNCRSLLNVEMPKSDCEISVCAFEKCDKRLLGELWIGNRYIKRLTEAVFQGGSALRDGVYELFFECSKNENLNEFREMFRIYLEVLNQIASVGLDHACHITYLFPEDRKKLAKVLFEDGYGKALYKLMHQASQLYLYMATRVTYVGDGDAKRLARRIQMDDEPNWMSKSNYVKARTELFGEMLERYHPETGDIGQTRETSSVEFGGLMEGMDEVFNSVYTQIYNDANRIIRHMSV